MNDKFVYYCCIHFHFFKLKNEKRKRKKNLLKSGTDPGTCDKVGSKFLVLTGRFQVPKDEEPVPEGRFQIPSGTCKESGTAHPY